MTTSPSLREAIEHVSRIAKDSYWTQWLKDDIKTLIQAAQEAERLREIVARATTTISKLAHEGADLRAKLEAEQDSVACEIITKNTEIAQLRAQLSAAQGCDIERVTKYLCDIPNNPAGYGDDPVGFLMASHAVLVHERQGCEGLVEALEHIIKHQKTIIPSMKGTTQIIAEQALAAYRKENGHE